MTSQMGSFSSAFSPIENESTIAKIMLDLLGAGFALAAAPVWNVGKFLGTAFKPLEYFPTTSQLLS